MIYQASKGSICFYYKGTLISGYGLNTKKSVDAYLYMGDHLIKESRHVNIKQQIETYINYCNIIHTRKNNKQKITQIEHQLFVSSLCALLRLKIIDNDDNNGYLVCPRK